MNTLTVIFEWCMSASIARTATVVVWREYHDMDGLGGAEMLEHGAGVATTGLLRMVAGCCILCSTSRTTSASFSLWRSGT